jgi:benzoyl-CoA reductase/2-hydroxyglutaryl-CoA dehydratase subunit BcrC/BadD/HgdB
VQEWKQQGGKVVGYFYSYIPSEIITAAGLLPFQLRATGSTGTEFSDAYFSQINCSFVRHSFNLALQGEQRFVDGVVSFNYCDHLRRLYDNWKAKVNTPFFHFLVLPTKRGENQNDFYRKELLQFKKSLEEHFEVVITDEKLRDAITLHNETRRLQRKLYELKKKPKPPLTGAETLAIMVAGTAMPKERYNQLLNELLEEVGNSEGQNSHIARLMLIGGDHLDNPGFAEVIENQGGLIVTDLLSFGTRAIWNDVDETGDPLSALASHYLAERPACPRSFGTTFERQAFIKKMATDFDVDGFISLHLSLCDLWAFEQDNLSKFLKKEHLPHLKLETEYILSSVGQLKTRVQAFLETIAEVKHDNSN